MSTACLLVFTDGRAECIERTLESAEENLIKPNPGFIKWRIIVNDAAHRPDYADWLSSKYGGEYLIVDHHTKRGFCGAIQSGWSFVPRSVDYVFHLEDDFTFNEPVNVVGMTHVLEQNPNIVQMTLKRQAWNAEEKRAGGFVELAPENFVETSDGEHTWTQHRVFFSTNPSLYRNDLIMEVPWPDPPACEGIFTHSLLEDRPESLFAFWGAKFDPPRVTHIGDNRVGEGY